MSMSLTATASAAATAAAVLMGQVPGASADDGNNETLVLEGLMIAAVAGSVTLTLLCCLNICFTNLLANEMLTPLFL